jgi:hypothetical protein
MVPFRTRVKKMHVVLAEIARDDPDPDRRLAAQLLLGHAQTAKPADESIDAAENYETFHNYGVDTFNDAIVAAGDRFGEAFVTALKLWGELLPDANTAAGRWLLHMVAEELWPQPRRRTVEFEEKLSPESHAATRLSNMPTPPPISPMAGAASARELA